VRGVRNARLEYGLEQARKLAAVLVVSDPAVQTALQSELPAICLLAKLDPTKVSMPLLQLLLLSSSVTVAGGVLLVLL
jgi:valyl-tRNA synthetase